MIIRQDLSTNCQLNSVMK